MELGRRQLAAQTDTRIHSRRCWQLSHILRLQVEVHDRLSSKPLSDPILEPMLSAIPDPFNAYAPNGNGHASSSSSSVHQGDSGAGAGEIFSVLQHSGTLGGSHPAAGVSSIAAMDHFNHDGWGSGSETLTPAGLLSPRTPSTGLPRAGSSAWGSPLNKRVLQGQAAAAAGAPGRRDDEAFAAAPAVLGSGSAAPPSTNATATTSTSSSGGGGTGPSGEFSFAALGLTSATHPQTSGVGGGTSSIGSPLFGSESGSDGQGRRHGLGESDEDDDDLQPLVVRRNTDEAEEVLADGEEEEGEGEGDGSGLTAGGASSRPSLPSTNSTSTVTGIGSKPVSSTTTAPASSSSSAIPGAKLRLGAGGSNASARAGVAGLGYRLKKALSIIDDEAITDEEKRKSLHEAVGGGGGGDGGGAISLDTDTDNEREARTVRKAGKGEVERGAVGEGEEGDGEGDTSGSKHSHGK